MIRIVASGNYFFELQDDVPLPDLNAALAEVCPVRIRRVDRFVQLALLGAARCVATAELREDCSIYVGSGLGPMSNNIATQHQVIRNAEMPKPVNFINTLGTSAGYHIARNLSLSGQSQFVARRGASFEAVLLAAIADLSCGATSQALIGVVEEATLPLADHRLRQNLADDTRIAEGSHWLLLERDGATGHALRSQRHATLESLTRALQGSLRGDDCLLIGCEVTAADRQLLQARIGTGAEERPAAWHDSITGALFVVAMTQLQPGGGLWLVDGSDERGWWLFHCRAQPSVD